MGLTKGKQTSENHWFRKYFQQMNISFQAKEIQSILYFALIWNIFEGRLSGTHASNPAFAKIAKKLKQEHKLDSIDYQLELAYFRSRYTTDGKINAKFYRLKVPNEYKEFIAKVLESSEQNVDQVVLGLMIIVYRLRNNFFHGVKSLERINSQSENFKIANKFLIQIMDIAL